MSVVTTLSSIAICRNSTDTAKKAKRKIPDLTYYFAAKYRLYAIDRHEVDGLYFEARELHSFHES